LSQWWAKISTKNLHRYFVPHVTYTTAGGSRINLPVNETIELNREKLSIELQIEVKAYNGPDVASQMQH
jgi:hypothetical protein